MADRGGCEVFNIETEHGLYFANGLLVHNSHKLKAPFGATQRFVASLAKKSTRVVGLSGTPMAHSPLDIFAQGRIIDPSAFGYSYVSFRARYAVMGGFNGKEVVAFKNRDEMRAKMARFVFQWDRIDGLPEEPLDIEVPIDLDAPTQRAYDEMERDLVTRVRAGEVNASNALVKLLRLQQLTGGTAAVDNDDGTTTLHTIGEEKQRALADILDGTDEPVVVFCRFRADLDGVAAVCKRLSEPLCELSGRTKQLEEWQDGRGRVLGVQIQAGGTGIDLTRAALAVYWSTGFSLGDYLQSRARLHRPGQTTRVRYHHLMASGTVDVRVLKALLKKQSVIEYVLANLAPEKARA